MSFLSTNDFWTALGTVGAAIAAMIAAFLAYLQVRSLRAAEIVPSLHFVGGLDLALEITNHGGVARKMVVNYEQVAGPKVISLTGADVVIRNGIDALGRSNSRSWTIGRVDDSRTFTQDHQAAAIILDSVGQTQFENYHEPFTLKVTISWDEPGVIRRRRDSFILIADRDLFDRSPKKQIFANLPTVG